MKSRVLNSLALVLLLCALAVAQDVASFEKRITVKKLDNGLTVLICERPEAPVFSFFTHVDAGSAQDPLGKTGLAHMFEHMAFKGTDKIGTTDYAAEKVALAKVEQAYAAYLEERDKRTGRDEQKLKDLDKQWKDAVQSPHAATLRLRASIRLLIRSRRPSNSFMNTKCSFPTQASWEQNI